MTTKSPGTRGARAGSGFSHVDWRWLVAFARVFVAVISSGPLALRQHGAGLLAGRAVDVVVAEEDLRGGSAGGAELGHVVRVDVDGGVGGLFHKLDGRCLAVGTGYAIGLAFGGLDDQEDTAVVSELLVQLEGEGVTLADDGGAGGILHTHQLGRVHLGLAAASDDPVVQAGEQVGSGDLGLGAEDAAAFLREGQLVPGEDLGGGQRLPHGGQTLEHTLDLGLVGGTYGATVTAVADVLAALHLCSGHALGAAAHLLEGDGRNVLHSGLGFEVRNKGIDKV